jgi:hypothetical protein
MALGGAALQQLLRQGPGSRGQQPLTAPASLPPPLGGWNTRDAFEAMDQQDAITLDNWYPDFGGIMIRPGASPWLNLFTGADISTLATWQALGSPQRLIAASAGALYDATGGGQVVPPAALATGFTSDWWQTAQFGGRLFLVNGRDPPQVYDGTTVAAAGFAAATGQPALDVTTLIGVQVIHNRLYFWDGKATGFWYGDLLAITGNLSWFPFDMVVPDGGGLVSVQVLSYDGGTGIASYTVFTLDTGTMLTYGGTDPSDPSNWALVGLYPVGPPMGLRSAARYGGDIYQSTSSDHLKLSQLLIALKLGQMPPRSKASGAQKAASQLGRPLPGWQAVYWPFGRRLLFNVPLPSGGFEQHVYNPPLDAWCRWQGLPSVCWVVWGDRLMFGAPNGQVCVADSAQGDQFLQIQNPWNTTPWNQKPWLIGRDQPIIAMGQQAWNLFGTPLTKRLAAVRPVVASDGDITYDFAIGFDYQDPQVFVPVGQAAIIESLWDVSPWDTSPWSVERTVEAQWQIASGDGSAISFAIAVQALHPLTWVRTDFRIEPGRAL